MPSNDTRLNQLIDARITAGSNRVALGKASGGTDAKQKALAVEEKADRALAVTEPEMPASEPSAPTGLTVEPFSRALAISWDAPPRSEYVRESEVRLYENPNPSGDVAERHLTNTSSHTSFNLLLKEYEVWVRHIDRWGREGQWSTALATPYASVADEITEQTQALGADFADLLNNPALNNFSSPDKLANATIQTLERASNGEYGADDVIGARMLAAWDVVAARAIIGNGIIERAMIANASISNAKIDDATITQAKIASVSARSIVTSSLDAATITLANKGKLVAGQTSLDSTGVSIAPASVYLNPGSDTAYKVSVNGDWSFMHFFTTSDWPPARGMHLRADGISGTARYGMLAFSATQGGSLAASESARAYLYKQQGGPPLFRVDGSIDARDGFDTDLGGFYTANGAVGTNTGNVYTNSGRIGPGYPNGTWARQLYAPGTTITNNGFYNIPHSFGQVPDFVDVQVYEGDSWRPVTDHARWEIYLESDRVNIYNRTGSSKNVRATIGNGS